MHTFRLSYGWVIPLFALALFLLTPFTSLAASTPAVPLSASDFSSLQKTCAVIDIFLHGTQNPTILCAQTKPISRVSPATGVAPCGTRHSTMVMATGSSMGGGHTVCFFGTGYFGYRVNDVRLVNSYQLDSWFLWYLPGYSQGTYYNLNQGNNWYGDFSGYHVDITQVDPGAQHA